MDTRKSIKEFLNRNKNFVLAIELDNLIHNYEKASELLNLFLKEKCYELFEEIKHGDQEHQDWLKNKIEEFLNKQL